MTKCARYGCNKPVGSMQHQTCTHKLCKKGPTTMLYECHVTVGREDGPAAEQIGRTLHWKYSAIDGDPVLGKKVFAYLTTHDADFSVIKGRMATVSRALQEAGIEVIREKIEHIVYDTKVGIGVAV